MSELNLVKRGEQKQLRDHWSILVKPTEACNLNCQYCYAKPFRDKYGVKVMTMETLDKIVSMCANYAKEIQWIWHGGEPTIVGIDFYEKAQKIFEKYPGTIFNQSLQTNGTLLNKEWGEMAKKYNISFGVSYDVFDQDIRMGDKIVNIEQNILDFKSTGANIGSITVINQKNYKKQIELYEYFKNKLGYNPAFNHIYRTNGSLDNDLEIGAQDYSVEFEKLYRHLINDSDDNSITERTCNLMTSQVIGNRNLVCNYHDCTHNWLGVTYNGDVYPCDRYVPQKYFLGNINDFDTIEDLYKTPGHVLYCEEKDQRYKNHCEACGFFDYCQGGCNANHIAVTGSNKDIDTFSCDLFKLEFFTAYKVLREIDIYNNKYNKKFVQQLLLEPAFMLIEIKDFLKSKNIELPEEELTLDNLLQSKEFKIFRIFNQFKGITISGHMNFYNYQTLGIENSLDDIKQNRLSIMEKRFELYKTKINEILN